MKKIDEQVRSTFAGIADVLIPEAEGMPAASAVGVQEQAYLDRILGLRPDLAEAFFRGIASAQGKDPRQAAEALHNEDAAAFGAIGLMAASAYYMAPRVRELIGYPGQTARPFDPDETPEYVTNGMLQRVINRGPIYRPTPQK
ncbi:hypothetical protein LMG24238_07744 [Paraburkholderia sediminicola]|uniref:Gluconate 2-dehydrogenase subunit 3-like protein n=1 Tax=Paraburkholderia sediminicola TaxID=458836 RepID=A0A6J5CXH9_9BURK|nr:hypothetical protein [Paraburkholderia sediminicola]CAB3745617.1 hypothetical protein LMG24238_07744 [Paraburkholderia sediminicola]